MSDPKLRLLTRFGAVGTVLAFMLVFNYCQVSINDAGTWSTVMGVLVAIDTLFMKISKQ